jgi:hypothetical protein
LHYFDEVVDDLNPVLVKKKPTRQTTDFYASLILLDITKLNGSITLLLFPASSLRQHDVCGDR